MTGSVRFSIKVPLMVAGSLLMLSCSTSNASIPLRKVADIPLPGAPVRFDYQSLDPAANRLYISHMNDDHVVVFNVKTNRVIANIPGTPGSTGVLAVPQVDRVYSAASRAGQVAVIDPSRLRVVAYVTAGRFPDGIAFDPVTKRLFVSDESGGAVAVIDPLGDRRIARIALGGGVGNTQYDPIGHMILVTVGDLNQLARIDPRSLRIAGRYPLAGAGHPHGLYIDAPDRLAFVACEGNNRLLVVDLRSMRVLAHFSVGEDPDVLAFDQGLRRLYIACESGIVSIFDLLGPHLSKRGDFYIAREAHSIAVDSRTHRVYLPLENVQGKPVLRIMSSS